MALIITFNVSSSRLPALISGVKALGAWGALTSTSYLVATDMRPGEVMERLHGFGAPDEDLGVLTASAPWASYGNVEVEDHAEVLGAPDDWTVGE
ncbi:MAG: hypothetical protein KF842_05370 [Caulobacter sp.]|nr:hypothetical protein [Caulobacter sp.]